MLLSALKREGKSLRNRFQTIHAVLHATGMILIVLGVLLLIPLLFVFFDGEIIANKRTMNAFIAPAAISFLLGFTFKKVFREGTPYTLRAMLICSVGWVVCSAIGALPFVIGIGSSCLDAYFETMSGFTTTGITMFSGLDSMPKSILFWRSLTQWLGGLGILTFFLAVGYRGRGAHRLFGAESHKVDVNRPVPGLDHTLMILWRIYTGFTLAIFISLLSAGMPVFDSLCHSLTTLSTGGFSPHDASIEFYRLNGHAHHVLIEYIILAGMLMGGINFLIHYRIMTGKVKALFDNSEMRYWWGIILVCTAVILLERYIKTAPEACVSPLTLEFWKKLEENFRIVIFQVVSLLTTSGFGTRGITTSFFGHTARQIFLVLMFFGGCVGSTSGGFKVLRGVILFKLIRREMFRLKSPPRAVSLVLIDGKPLSGDEIKRTAALFSAWILLLVFGGLVTAFLSDHDGYSSFSGMFSALGNIGPCYISAADMVRLNPLIKLVYIFGMLAGRLEILPALVLLNPRLWKY